MARSDPANVAVMAHGKSAFGGKVMYRTGAVRKTMNLAGALALTGVGAYLPFFTLLGGVAAWPMLTTLVFSAWDVGPFYFMLRRLRSECARACPRNRLYL
jgi:hypothetical protein